MDPRPTVDLAAIPQPTPEEEREAVLAERLDWEAEQEARAASRPAVGEEGLRELVAEGIEAFQLTREYVGLDLLPAEEGWSWFDWTTKAKAALTAEEKS